MLLWLVLVLDWFLIIGSLWQSLLIFFPIKISRGFVSDIKKKLIYRGDLNDHESLVEAIKAVDVVISAVGVRQVMDQMKIIAAIKEAGTVKVEFGKIYLFFIKC